MTSTKYEDKIAAKPNIKSILKAIGWILCNRKYLSEKCKKIGEYRKISTNQLREMKILSDIKQ